MFKNAAFFFFLMVTGIFFCTACRDLDDISNATIEASNAEFAVPVFNSTVSFQDIIDNTDENTFLTIDPDGLLRLNYKGDVLSVSSEDLFDALIPLLVPIPILDTNVVTDFEIPGSVDIDFMDFKAGTLGFIFENKHDQDMTVDFYVDEVEKDGETFHLSTTVAAGDDGGITANLEGWRWNALDDQFSVRYEAIKSDGTRDTLNEIIMGLVGLKYAYAEGYLGNDLYLIGRDTIEIDFFDNWTRGDISFEDPRISLTAFNSFGFPLDGQFKNILIQTLDGDIIPLESEFVTNGVFLDYPKLNEVGISKKTNFDFNSNNSNIVDVLAAGPVAIDYHIDGEPNPNMDETIRGFMLDTSEIRVQLEVELPLHGAANGFSVSDTFDIDLADYDQVDHAEFKLITENNMPVSVDVQLYFADANATIIDSLLTTVERVVEGAPVDALGNVTNPQETTLFIPVASERLDRMLAAEKMILFTEFATSNDGNIPVRILANHDINVRMGVKFGLE